MSISEEKTELITNNKIKIIRTQKKVDINTALDFVWSTIDDHKGILLISNYEVPSRFSRWDLGFANPPLELYSKGRTIYINALNAEGQQILPHFELVLRQHEHVQDLQATVQSITAHVIDSNSFFTEEERSRQPSVFTVIRSLLGYFHCDEERLGFYGAFGYDMVFQFEKLQQRTERVPHQNDCHLFFATRVTVIDRRLEVADEISFNIQNINGAGFSELSDEGQQFTYPDASYSPEHKWDISDDDFAKMVERVREGCRKGDHYEVVLSRTCSTTMPFQPSAIFRRIATRNPSPYSFLINMGNEAIVGASPEMYVRVIGNRVETSPISGTVPVGDTPMETAAHIQHLISSEKEESELTMCTDVDRNDLARICKPGSVNLLGRRLIERYSRLIHTSDHIEGELLDGYDGLDAVVSHLWACTISGSPKPAAQQLIEDLEKSPRRWYSGAVGVLSVNGNVNTGMILRTVHLEDGMAHVRAGATLLYESDPVRESQETKLKASAFLGALADEVPAQNSVKRHSKPLEALNRVLFIDFLDSFVHMLASYVRFGGAAVQTVRIEHAAKMLSEQDYDLVFLSPGPGTPQSRGVLEVVAEVVKLGIPLFGVCLGHQGIAQHFGAKLGVLDEPCHGKRDSVYHEGGLLYEGLPNPFSAGRYHSLYVVKDSLPQEFKINAYNKDGLIMGIEHRELPIAAIQFHPESILSLEQHNGQRLIDNLLSKWLPAEK